MIAFLLPILQALLASPLLRKVGAMVLGAAGAAFAVWAYTAHVKHEAVAAYKAEQAVVAAAEHERRIKVLAEAQKGAAADLAQIAVLQHKNEKLQREIERLSAAHDDQPCLDAGSVQRLRAAGTRQ